MNSFRVKRSTVKAEKKQPVKPDRMLYNFSNAAVEKNEFSIVHQVPEESPAEQLQPEYKMKEQS